MQVGVSYELSVNFAIAGVIKRSPARRLLTGLVDSA
jgi:hypothetical protein